MKHNKPPDLQQKSHLPGNSWQIQQVLSLLCTLKEDPNMNPVSLDLIKFFLKNINLPDLTDSLTPELNLKFTELEIVQIACNLPPVKSADHNGYSNEYYKTFMPILLLIFVIFLTWW